MAEKQNPTIPQQSPSSRQDLADRIGFLIARAWLRQRQSLVLPRSTTAPAGTPAPAARKPLPGIH